MIVKKRKEERNGNNVKNLGKLWCTVRRISQHIHIRQSTRKCYLMGHIDSTNTGRLGYVREHFRRAYNHRPMGLQLHRQRAARWRQRAGILRGGQRQQTPPRCAKDRKLINRKEDIL